MEPSGKGWPLTGTPALNDLIIFGLATMTLSISSVRAEETTDQSSYPLKSENAIPLGDFSKYLSCAKTAVATRTASTATALATMVKPVMRSPAVRVSIFCSCLFLLFLRHRFRHKFRHGV